MPKGDGTGPTGSGPMTGRGLGSCTGTRLVRYGAGFGMRLGRRLFRRRNFAGGRGKGFAMSQNSANRRR